MEDFLLKPIINSVVYSFLGFIILLICYFFLEKLTPEKTWKEIVENKNIALAIVLASFILGISLIIGLAIHG
jgi:putative membrane protein